ncbi:MAG TPA: histidine kinase dimerization/phospho-acceptor domain-containing protein [Pyrinomonadaceae bacterium]|nr:histidine kinase dimerization/phospho-acceptor domain-containing protein [Pyrinomonadaceae bacterium]
MPANSLNEAGAVDEGRREAELRRALSDCDERLAAFAELAARVRHEINNPLTGLIGQTQLLLREDLTETARRRVLTIEQLANRIRDTVAELRMLQMPVPKSLGGEGLYSSEKERE